jgi:tRNA 2-thiocytidine biosynthesis protein TtcA
MLAKKAGIMSNRRTKLIFRQVRDANLKYHLIENGDRVAVGMSGGKDSATLLYSLKLLQQYTPLMFELVPIYVDLGWGNQTEPLQDFCTQFGLQLVIHKTNIGEIVFQARKESHPCSLCANLRRGALHNVSKEYGCNKVALGHHLDDVVNTLLMSILYEGRYQVFTPKTWLDRIDITVIRPLIYVEERDIKLLADSLHFPVIKNQCPADGTTKRTEIAEFMNAFEQKFPGARRRFLSAIEKVGLNAFWR